MEERTERETDPCLGHFNRELLNNMARNILPEKTQDQAGRLNSDEMGHNPTTYLGIFITFKESRKQLTTVEKTGKRARAQAV